MPIDSYRDKPYICSLCANLRFSDLWQLGGTKVLENVSGSRFPSISCWGWLFGKWVKTGGLLRLGCLLDRCWLLCLDCIIYVSRFLILAFRSHCDVLRSSIHGILRNIWAVPARHCCFHQPAIFERVSIRLRFHCALVALKHHILFFFALNVFCDLLRELRGVQ